MNTQYDQIERHVPPTTAFEALHENEVLQTQLRQARDEDFPRFQQTLRNDFQHIDPLIEGSKPVFFPKKTTTESVNRVCIDEALYRSMIQSNCQHFSGYIAQLKQNEPDNYIHYQKLEQLVFPSFAMDHMLINQHLIQMGTQSLQIPPQFKTYQEAITLLKGTPLTNMLALIISYAAGFGPYVLGNVVTSQLTDVAFFGRLLLSASPIGIGGFLRFWVANQVDTGHGKKAVLFLLLLGMIGLIGITATIHTIDLAKVHVLDRNYWTLFIFNLLSGAGVANYSSSVVMSAQCAPNDNPILWRTRLKHYGINNAGYFNEKLANILRQNAKTYVAIVAGAGSLAPSLTLIAAASLKPYLGLKGIYALFGSTTLFCIFITYYFLQDALLDQLRRQNVPDHIAKDLARWLGQTLQSQPELTLLQRLNQLNRSQIFALSVACFNYVTTFGVLLAMTSTGTLVLSRYGAPPQLATYLTAMISGLSSLTRTLMTYHPFKIDSSMITNIGFLVMIPSFLIFSLNHQRHIWFPMLILFSIANGVSNYGVFAQISDTLSEIMGLASGLSGATGAISGFFICIAFASLCDTDKKTGHEMNGIEQTTTTHAYLLATAFCTASLGLNIFHESYRKKQRHIQLETAIESEEQRGLALT